jgi:hypothetical protein
VCVYSINQCTYEVGGAPPPPGREGGGKKDGGVCVCVCWARGGLNYV